MSPRLKEIISRVSLTIFFVEIVVTSDSSIVR